MSTWDRMQPTHMLDGLGGMLTPHKQHSLCRQQQAQPHQSSLPLNDAARPVSLGPGQLPSVNHNISREAASAMRCSIPTDVNLA